MSKRILKKETAILERLQSVGEQLKYYPTPVAGCDEQFNFLISERDRLTNDLNNIRRGELGEG